MEGYQGGGGEGRMAEKIQGIRSIYDRYKLDRGRLRTVWKWRRPKTYVYNPRTRTKVGECWWEGGYRVEGNKGGEMGQL